jgi:hypothetical protein
MEEITDAALAAPYPEPPQAPSEFRP